MHYSDPIMTNMEDHSDSTYWNKSNLISISSISILDEKNTIGANCYRKVCEQVLFHHQHQCINRIGASAGSAHLQDRRISRIGASARSAHQQDRRINRMGASAGLAHQQDRHISRIGASAGSPHQQDWCIRKVHHHLRCITT